MARVRLSADARSDLRIIGEEGLLKHGPVASQAYLDGFRPLFRLLRDHPLAGQEWPELELDVRILSHRPYRILYRVGDGSVVIARVIHQSRDVGHALRDLQ